MDDELYMAEIEMQWLLYDGGMRKGYLQQTENYVKIMNQESRRTDLEINDSVALLLRRRRGSAITSAW
jgi:outer membrane protein